MKKEFELSSPNNETLQEVTDKKVDEVFASYLNNGATYLQCEALIYEYNNTKSNPSAFEGTVRFAIAAKKALIKYSNQIISEANKERLQTIINIILNQGKIFDTYKNLQEIILDEKSSDDEILAAVKQTRIIAIRTNQKLVKIASEIK